MATKKKKKERPLFARNFSYLRNQQRLTRRDMSKATGIAMSTWGSYEEGRAFPRWWNMKAICDTLQFYDILTLITKDLADEKKLQQVNAGDALQALRKVEQFFKQPKVRV